MYWLKTKIKHILYNNFTDREFTKFMKIRALTCQLGEIPKDYQIATVCPQKTYESICKRLANDKQTLSEVLAKDIEDASEVEGKREYWKRNKRHQREKTTPVHKDKLGQSQQEIRVDKIRLNTIDQEFEKLWEVYPRKQGKVKSQSIYTKLHSTNKNIYQQIETAIKNYNMSCVDNKTEPRYVMHGSTFFGGRWEDYIDYKPVKSGTYDWTKGLGDKNANI